jgi:hypothetical protein
MTPKELPVIVVFRKWKAPFDGILALFSHVRHSGHLCMSYEHVGQHGGADYTGCISVTRPATPEEYKDLKSELEQIGYNLQIRKRST